MKRLYFDEAGFTGNNLTDPSQPYFAFAGVEIDHDDADRYVNDIRRRFRIAAPELKGGRLCRREGFHAAVAQILSDHADSASVVVYDKMFGLAAKMFEYLVEPIISSVSRAFYDREFHLFVANGLYAQMMADDGKAREILHRFQSAMRGLNDGEIETLTNSVSTVDGADVAQQIVTLLICNRDVVAKEITSLDLTATGRWSLDLSLSAIFSLLREWGTDMHPLSVCCDASKPLTDQKEALDAMIDRNDQSTIYFCGREHNVLFNLAHAVEMRDSAITPGIQLADIFASAAVYAMNNPNSRVADAYNSFGDRIISEETLMPDISHFDLTENRRAKLNAVALHGLVDQSVKGEFVASRWPILLEMQDRMHLG